MKICILQPDYSNSTVDYKNYDPPRDLAHLLPEAEFEHVFLNKLSTYRQLKALKPEGFDIFVNLCEGYLEWDVPSIDVIYALELLNLPYTGSPAFLYDPPKELMKYVAYTAGIDTPDFGVVERLEDLAANCDHLDFPLFVKPAKAGDSLGINDSSLVKNPQELSKKVEAIISQYDTALVERYIPGREFTVLVAANPDPYQAPVTYQPLEFVFPSGHSFKSYDLKITQWHPECNVPCQDEKLAGSLREAASKIFKAFGGLGYARLDFRVDDTGTIFFLEINFACSVFYAKGYEGSADYILKHDGAGQASFLRHIIAEGMARWRLRQKKHLIKSKGVSGYGIFAACDLAPGELVWQGEERAQRIATRAWVAEHWSAEDMDAFRRYAYPVSSEVYILWDADPNNWAPTNHSCDPNTVYQGMNLLALRHIAAGEELTYDYATISDETAAPFECSCGATNCRGVVLGTPGNSVVARERRSL